MENGCCVENQPGLIGKVGKTDGTWLRIACQCPQTNSASGGTTWVEVWGRCLQGKEQLNWEGTGWALSWSQRQGLRWRQQPNYQTWRDANAGLPTFQTPLHLVSSQALLTFPLRPLCVHTVQSAVRTWLLVFPVPWILVNASFFILHWLILPPSQPVSTTLEPRMTSAPSLALILENMPCIILALENVLMAGIIVDTH